MSLLRRILISAMAPRLFSMLLAPCQRADAGSRGRLGAIGKYDKIAGKADQ